MDLFKDILKDSESLFRNEVALDPSYMPKEIKFRENQHHYIANCVKPLFQKRNGKNLFVFGGPGIGKTLACKNILRELEEYNDEVVPIYINLWKKDTSYKIVLEICKQIDYNWTYNRTTEDLLKEIIKRLNQKSVVIVFDECDKLKLSESNLIYVLLEDLYRKTMIFVTNDGGWLDTLEPRLKSRLLLELLEFKPYSYEETKGILEERKRLAFVSGAFDQEGFEEIVKKTFELKDIRVGLYLLKEAGNSAEGKSCKKIGKEDSLEAIKKLKDFQKPVELGKEEKEILGIIEKNPEKSTPELFNLYKKEGGNIIRRTFQKKISKLKKLNLIIKKEVNGIHGKSFKIKVKDLSEFLE